MKVILLEDIKGVGKKGELLNASDGHARNYLIPRKLAVEATKTNLNELNLKQKSEEHKKEVELQAAKDLGQTLEQKTVKIAVKIGDNGKLFGSVTNKEIAAALEAQEGIKIDKKKITIVDPIKTVGEKEADIKLHPKVTVKLKVVVFEG